MRKVRGYLAGITSKGPAGIAIFVVVGVLPTLMMAYIAVQMIAAMFGVQLPPLPGQRGLR
jgi:hypothetical protein